MTGGFGTLRSVANGDQCLVLRGAHAGKSGVIRDRNMSATGHVTITVEQADGVKFKTLAKNVSAHA